MSRNVSAEAWPLSTLQHGMLFHHLQEPHAGVDIEQLVVHLPERIAAHRLEAAWRWLVQRHDILRARCVWDGVEHPHFEILPDVSIPFALESAEHLTADGRGERLRAFLEADRVRGFGLNQAPLLRLTLFAWDETSFSLVWTFHHVLLDGRTFPVLLREVFEAYDEMDAGPPASRPEPPSYRQHLAWLQRSTFTGADGFWRNLLAGFTAATPLVVDTRRPGRRPGPRQRDAWEQIDADTTRRLRALAGANGLTMNTLVLGAWAILLHRYSGDEDVVFGATRACRRSSVEEADRTIGLFINTVPVRVAVHAGDSLLAVLEAVRGQCLDVRSHEHTPLARVKGVSQVPSARPLFESLVVFERARLDATMRALGGAWARRHVELHEFTGLPVTLAAYDGEVLSLKLAFDRDRLDDDASRRMAGHVRRLLEGVAANPNATVGSLALIDDVERGALIAGAAPIATDRGSILPIDGQATLHGLFEAQAARCPDRVAVTCEGASLTYAELNARANRLARELVGLGVGPETLVGLCLGRSTDLIVGMLAILKAGGAYLPLDPAYPPDRLAFMLDDARAPVLLTETALAGAVPAARAATVCLDDVLALPSVSGDDRNLERATDPDHLAYVIYTSGTTGRPKGSLVTHRNVVRLFPAAAGCFDFSERDVWTLFHSSAFDFSVWEVWGALLYGGRLVVVPFLVSRSPEAFYQLVAGEQVTVLNQTPSAFRQFLHAEDAVGAEKLALRYVIFGGEALDVAMLKPWFERHGDRQPLLVNMYGITETTVHVTYRRLSAADLEGGSVIGVPLDDLRVHILDGRREPVPVGVPGEMYVGGAGLARGYLHRAELTGQRFVPDHLSDAPGARLYKTGDLARRLPGQDIEYLGRIDDQVKIRGFRVELGEIESVLRQHPAILEATIVARGDAPGTRQLVAYVVAGSRTDISALREHLLAKLPDYMVPASFVFLEGLPLTANGKIDRKALPDPGRQRPELAAGYVAPRTAAEQALASIWSQVLGVEQVGIQDNFFALGGDSILSIQVISQARKHGLELSPRLLFAHQTIAALASVVRVAEPAPVAETPVAGNVPLTPIQAWFFEQALEAAEHYNQGFVLETPRLLEQGLLERALDAVRAHHDALRLRYVRQPAGWHQRYADADEPLPLTWTDLTDTPEADRERRVEAISAGMHATLDLAHGPIWRAAYVSFGPDRGGRLVLVVHHLAIDGVSWRPLLEDLEAAYRQLEAGRIPILPAKTSSCQAWAERLRTLARTETLQSELGYWATVADPRADGLVSDAASPATAGSQNTVGGAATLTVSLTPQETHALLQDVPAAYGTQINDVLLAALTRAWTRSNGGRVLVTDVEGHGREPLFDDVDLSRTVGWFTSIFPVRLELPETAAAERWRPGDALASIKAQLGRIPRRGIGYGVLRYLAVDPGLAAQPERPILFNYLGRFDQVLAGSTLFRFAPGVGRGWRSPGQCRRHAIELNCMVLDGRLEFAWTYSERRHTDTAIRRLADDLVAALREVIAHGQVSEPSRTAADFPLARLTDADLDRFVAGQRDVEDILPLSPIQRLFHSANAGGGRAVFDQWLCTLRGPLDVSACQQAWLDVARRHSILRSTIHGDAVHGPVQIVRREASQSWTVEDWRGIPAAQQDEHWLDFLARDRARPLPSSPSPPMRFALVRFDDEAWKFVWSVPALLLDGWSWPLVFGDASRLYEASRTGVRPDLEPAHQYREYIEWAAAQAPAAGQEFWRGALAGFREPTPLGGRVADAAESSAGDSERYVRVPVPVSPETSAALGAAARLGQVTLNTLVQGGWAILLAHRAGRSDVVFGAAFNGRPTDLPGAETIVGPFVNNLPVRVTVSGDAVAGAFFTHLHNRTFELGSFQFTPLVDIQRASDVPWRHRLFDSLVVFQNYAVDREARRFGAQIAVEDFAGPIHTHYPVLLLAEPAAELRLTLIHDCRSIAPATAEQWALDLGALLARVPDALANARRIAGLQAGLTPPVAASAIGTGRSPIRSRRAGGPRTAMERTIAAVWQQLFDGEPIDVDANLFDLGGTSLLVLQAHLLLQKALARPFPIVALFEHPTVGALARHFDESPDAQPDADQWRRRAERQKRALDRIRVRSTSQQP